MTATRIDVNPSDGGPPYPVVVGVGVLGELPGLVPESARTVVVIHAEGLGEIARPACGALRAAGLTVHAEPVPDGEPAKNVDVAAGLWSRLARHGVTRSDCIVGIGGGAATDLAGFVAATWLRGVRVVLVPTTLLGMADAAVGGKTAIDIPEGKNLVGAFHSPAGVLADLVTLETLPREDYVSGLAEVIKTGFIADPVILDLVRADPEGAVVPHGPHARELVERAIAVKAEVVSKDLNETGLREVLNYGHTLGHAIERVEGYRFRHGYAVAIGMVYVAELARLAGGWTSRPVRCTGRSWPPSACPPRTRPGCGRCCARPWAWTRRPGGRGSGWWCWTAWAAPRSWMARPRNCCGRRTGKYPSSRLSYAPVMRIGMFLSYAGGFAETVTDLADYEKAGLGIVFVPEAYSFDAVSQLGFLAAKTERVQIASGIFQLYSRTPALTAMTAAGLDYVSGGRFMLGLGASGPQVIEGWHGVPYDAPIGRTREVIEICRMVWRRERLSYQGRYYQLPLEGGTGLGKPLKLINHPVRERIPIALAAIGPKNVALAAELAEAWMPIFYLPEKAGDVWGAAVAEGSARRDAALGPLDVIAAAPLAIGEDSDTVRLRDLGRPQLALYIGGMGARGRNFYNDLARRLGYEAEAKAIQDAYLDGRKAEAEALVPEQMLERTSLIGPESYVAERIAAYREAGVTTLNVTPLAPEHGARVRLIEQVRAMAD